MIETARINMSEDPTRVILNIGGGGTGEITFIHRDTCGNGDHGAS